MVGMVEEPVLPIDFKDGRPSSATLVRSFLVRTTSTLSLVLTDELLVTFVRSLKSATAPWPALRGSPPRTVLRGSPPLSMSTSFRAMEPGERTLPAYLLSPITREIASRPLSSSLSNSETRPTRFLICFFNIKFSFSKKLFFSFSLLSSGEFFMIFSFSPSCSCVSHTNSSSSSSSWVIMFPSRDSDINLKKYLDQNSSGFKVAGTSSA
mmetsp:Transcript_20636/g.19978  ORF Transcript_20636/g.19978 Transcript_20636/m.19978 type:complete len:209 (-) Transcript_20636:382-1008(-)